MTAHFVEKRRPPFWLAALALSCATSKSSESQLQLSGKEETRSETREIAVQRVQTGPETITTTVDEYAILGGGDHPNPRRDGDSGRNSTVDAKPEIAPRLVKRTVTVDQRGASTSETSLNGRTATQSNAGVEVKAEAKETSKTRWGPPWWAYALIAGVLAALAGAAFFKPPLLLKLLARIFP